MPRPVRLLFAILIAAVVLGGPMVYYSFRYRNFRNLHVVTRDVLYRSGQMSLIGLQRALHDYEIRTVVTLRDAHEPGNPPPDLAEADYCRKNGITYFRLPPRPWETAADGSVPAEQNVRKFLAIMDDPKNYPVLVHCFAGSHRTGAYVAIYRMEYQGWSNRQVLEEMMLHGYDNLWEEWDIESYLESYRTRKQRGALAEAEIRDYDPTAEAPPPDFEGSVTVPPR
jgi:tyrosine-protein phosphatase SIW14